MLLVDYADSYCTAVHGSDGYREQLRVLASRLPWRVHDLSPSAISEYLSGALKKLSPTTVSNHRRMLLTLLRAAQRDGLARHSTDGVRRVKHFSLESLGRLPRYDRIIFGTIISVDQIKKVMRRLIQRAGLEGSGKYLRRSSATYAEQSGISASFQLGHKTPGMAWRHYVDQVILAERRKPVPSIPQAAAG